MSNHDQLPSPDHHVLKGRYGFNFGWMFWKEGDARPQPPDLKALDFMAYYGLNFVRIPASYFFWTKDYCYDQPDPAIWPVLDSYLAACRERGIHMCFNMHRAPGYCIGGPRDLERDNLWTDRIAQDGFVFQWEWFARHFRGVPAEALSFNLVNEPHYPSGPFGITKESHEAIMRRTVAAIRAIDPHRPIVLDGMGGGDWAMPELADLGVIQSGRGYQPHALTHYQAPWYPCGTVPPVWPGVEWAGKPWDRDTLRAYYEPWRAIEKLGVPVHIGEFGCYNTPSNDVALAWFADLFSLWREYGWGYAMWTFYDSFGIVEHGRPGAHYETLHGLKVDRELFDLFLGGRVTAG